MAEKDFLYVYHSATWLQCNQQHIENEKPK